MLRQGDLLSPLLFIIVMKALNNTIEKAKEENLIRGIVVGSDSDQLEVSHLFFCR